TRAILWPRALRHHPTPPTCTRRRSDMRFGSRDGRLILVSDSGVLDLHEASAGALPADPLAALARWDEGREIAAAVDWSGAQPSLPDRLGPPVPQPRQVFAIG